MRTRVADNNMLLLAIHSPGGLAAYFNAYPTVKYLNKTYILTPTMTPAPSPTVGSGILNPAPGVCLPIIVKFCQQQNVPYNFTVYPNYIGNFGQIEAQAVSLFALRGWWGGKYDDDGIRLAWERESCKSPRLI